jgi:hypothetical protein
MGKKHTCYKEKHRRLVFSSKQTELELNAEKTKYTVMSLDQNAGRSHSIKNDNSSCPMVREYKFLEKTKTNQNSIQEDNHNTLQSGNACCHSLKNLLSSSLLSKIINIRNQITVILSVVL